MTGGVFSVCFRFMLGPTTLNNHWPISLFGRSPSFVAKTNEILVAAQPKRKDKLLDFAVDRGGKGQIVRTLVASARRDSRDKINR